MGKSEIDNTKQKRATTRKAPRGKGEGRRAAAASVMTVDKQQQCGMAQDTCHEMKGNREKNEEQGEKISHFLSRVLQGMREGMWMLRVASLVLVVFQRVLLK